MQPESAEEAQRFFTAGRDCRQRGDLQGAIQMFERCRASGQKVRDAGLARSVEATSLGNLGLTYNNLGQYDKAIDHLTRSLAIQEEIGDRQGVASSLGSLGNIYDSLGQYDKAIDHYTRSLAIEEELGLRQGLASSLGNLGNAYSSFGQYDKAIDHQTRSLAINEEIGNRQGAANTVE